MKRLFTEAEVKEAENMMTMLAMYSAKFWAEALVSDKFLCCKNITGKDYVDSGVYWCIENAQKVEVSATQILMFMDSYMSLALEEIARDIQSDECVAYVLGRRVIGTYSGKERIEIDGDGEKIYYICTHGGYDQICFGGVDNDPWGCVAKAKAKAEIPGIFIGHRKTQVVLTKRKIQLWHLGLSGNPFMTL